MECQVTGDKIKRGFRANNIEPGKDGKYSLKDVVLALTSRSGLEQKAKEAKYQRQIEEAELARNERLEHRGLLAPIEMLEHYAEDVLARCVSAIRHMPCEDKFKDQAIALLRAAEFKPMSAGKKKNRSDK